MSKSKFKLKEKRWSSRFGDILFVSKALNTLTLVSFILEARGCSRAESPKRTHIVRRDEVEDSSAEEIRVF